MLDQAEGSDRIATSSAAKIVYRDEKAEREVEIGSEIVLGRGGSLGLSDGRVSRRHARVYLEDDDYKVEDLRSSNGTFVNQHRVEEPFTLTSGDRINVGPYELSFELEINPETSRVVARAGIPTPVLAPRRATVEGGSLALAEFFPERGTEALDSKKEEGDSGLEEVESAVRRPVTEQKSEPAPEGKLIVSMGSDSLSFVIGDELPLTYVFKLGELAVEGAMSRIVRQDAEYWVEPASGSSSPVVNGMAVKKRMLLRRGDLVEVGPLTAIFE